MRLSRDQLRTRFAELRALVGRHDPFGLLSHGAPADEYDDIVGPLLRRLERGESAEGIAAWLKGEVANNYGLPPAMPDTLAVDAAAWYATAWPGSEAVPSGDGDS